MKKQNGITLVALVITIIVLLVLAGVSISLVVGENGVLGKAQKAVSSTKIGAAREQVVMAWQSCETDYLAYGRGQQKSTYFSVAKLNENLSEGKVTAVSCGINANGDSELAYKVDDVYYKMQITSAGVVTVVGEPTSTAPTLTEPVVPTLASKIDATNYGDYVNYSKDLGLTLSLEGESTTPTTDWRIFYEDTEQDRVYLIASDYVPNTSSLLKLSSVGMTTNGDYSLYWNSVPSALSSVSRQDSIFGINSNSYVLNASNANSKCVSNLLDTDHWSNFVDTMVADYAIGGPTIEMYTNSWNAKGYGTLTLTSESTATGYKLNGANSVNMSSDTGYGDNLYYTHKIDSGIGSEWCFGYMLASPSANSADNVMCVGYDGYVGDGIYSSSYVSVRPVVSLKSGIIASQDDNGIWQIGE